MLHFDMVHLKNLILDLFLLLKDLIFHLLEYIEKRSKLPLFANARTISNAIDTARMKHANRMFNSGDAVLTKSDLVTLEAVDIIESSLFAELG